MTVETDLDRAQYATNATTGPWTVPFYFLASDELAVTYTDAAGTDQLLAIDLDYTVVGAGDEDGGTVTTATAYGAGGFITILRDVQFLQETEYTDGDPLPAKTLERGLDRLTMLAQQLREVVSRTLRFAASDSNSPQLPSAAQRANTVLGFDSNGDILPTIPVSGTAADVLITLADKTTAAKGAGAVGFLYSLLYSALTTGWALKLGTVKAAWFYASVAGSNWTPALQAAHNFAALLPNGGVVELATDRLYACTTGLTWNTNKVGLKGNGAILDFSGFNTSGGVALDIRQSDPDPNVRGTLNAAHPFEHVVFLGPGGSHLNTAVRGLDTNLIGGNPWMAGVTFKGCAFRNWWRDVELNAGTFLWRFEGCRFSISGLDVTYDVSIYIPFATNSGENTVFDHCFFGKVYGSVVRQTNSNASTRFVNCSADYNDRIFDVQGGRVEWDGYIESDRDNNYWATVGAENAFLRIAGPVVLTNSTPKTFELFAVDPAGTNGGLDLDIELAIGGGGGMGTLNLCKGLTAATSGRVVCRLRSHSKITPHPAIGGGCTVLANGDFETASLTDGTLSGAVTPPSIVTSPAGHSGAHCLRFAGSSTNVPGWVRSVPCRAGQQAVGSLWYQTQGLAGTGGTFFITLTYVDAGGATLSAATELSTQLNVSTYTFLNVSQQQPAPPGAVAAVLSIQLFGTTTGAPNGYVSDLTFAVV